VKGMKEENGGKKVDQFRAIYMRERTLYLISIDLHVHMYTSWVNSYLSWDELGCLRLVLQEHLN